MQAAASNHANRDRNDPRIDQTGAHRRPPSVPRSVSFGGRTPPPHTAASTSTSSISPPTPYPFPSSSQSQNKYLGVTPPISTSEPNKYEIEATASLIQTLKTMGQFESETEAKRREVVLGKLNVMVKDFVTNVSIKRGLPESIAREAGGKIFTFGSYRLGVHSAGADIDTLCVAPRHVQREDFFADFVTMLKTRSEVTDLTPVPDAYVPVIKLVFSGIPIDLVFARLMLARIPDDLDLKDDNLLKNLDEPSIRSLNGSRVTDGILGLVPNVEAFRLALRCIKLWARNRAIYSNVMGFLGGVAWAMLVARVCQLYPNATAGAIVAKFFLIMHQWNWPQPVLLKPIEDGPLQVRVWNPKLYSADKAHRMPIITPAYPSMCATHNVTHSTQTIMTSEFKRGADIVDSISMRKKRWDDLFAKHNFFTRYRRYLRVIAVCSDEEKHLKYSGMVESRLRQLVMKLEQVENLVLAHPFVKDFPMKMRVKDAREVLRRGGFPDAGQIQAVSFPNGVCVTPMDVDGTDDREKSGSAEMKIRSGQGEAPVQEQQAGQPQSGADGDEGVTEYNLFLTTLYVGLFIEPKVKGANGDAGDTGQAHRHSLQQNQRQLSQTSLNTPRAGPSGAATAHSHTISTATTVSAATSTPTSEPRPKRTLDLSHSIQDFATLIKSWDSFDPACMSIAVELQKASLLPEEVHPEMDEEDVRVLRKKRLRKGKSCDSLVGTAGIKRKQADEREGGTAPVERRKKRRTTPAGNTGAEGMVTSNATTSTPTSTPHPTHGADAPNAHISHRIPGPANPLSPPEPPLAPSNPASSLSHAPATTTAATASGTTAPSSTASSAGPAAVA